MSYIQKHDFKAFGVYRIVLGVLVIGYFVGKKSFRINIEWGNTADKEGFYGKLCDGAGSGNYQFPVYII